MPTYEIPLTPYGEGQKAVNCTKPSAVAYLVVVVYKDEPTTVFSQWVIAESENGAKLKAWRELHLPLEYDDYELEIALLASMPQVSLKKDKEKDKK